MKKLIFIFSTLLVLVVVTGCNSRNDTVRFNTNIIDTEESAEEVSEGEDSETEEDTSMKEAADENREESDLNPVEATDNLPYVGSSTWLALIFSLMLSGAYTAIRNAKKS